MKSIKVIYRNFLDELKRIERFKAVTENSYLVSIILSDKYDLVNEWYPDWDNEEKIKENCKWITLDEYKNLVDLFRGQAKNKDSDLDFIDVSLRVPFNSENAEYIKRGIRERIKRSSVTIVLIGETSHESEWIDWEVRESLRLGKGVIAVKLESDSGLKIPRALIDNGITPLPWDHEKISDAIHKAAENR